MSIELAYSIDLQREVSAEVADLYFREGKIKSKYRFRCVEKNCDAQITCANLDKPKKLRRRDPYFKYVSGHSEECRIGKLTKERLKTTHYSDLYQDTDEYRTDTVRLDLSSSGPTKNALGRCDEEEGSKPGGRSGSDSRGSGKRKIQRQKRLCSLVDCYTKGEYFDVELPDEIINLKDMFIRINGQDITTFYDDLRVYFGRAFFNRSKKDNGFVVRFGEKLKYQELSVLPTFFIPDRTLEYSRRAKYTKESLMPLVDKRSKWVYLLSDTSPHKSIHGDYINFNFSGTEYIEYRT